MMSRFNWFSLALVLSLVPLVGCAPSASEGTASLPKAGDSITTRPTADQIGESLGTVNGQTIGSKEFDHMATRQVGRDGSLSEEARRDIIGRLVDEKLLYQEALRRGHAKYQGHSG